MDHLKIDPLRLSLRILRLFPAVGASLTDLNHKPTLTGGSAYGLIRIVQFIQNKWHSIVY
jgi:hypothetical protein